MQNGSLEYTWTLNPRIIWTSHFAVDRAVQPQTTSIPSLSSAGLPSVLNANGIDRMPTIQMTGASPWSSLYDQCCINTNFAHTLYSYSSQLVISKGSHLMKMGGEQRIFFNNFFQPPYPTGLLNFTDFVTSPFPNSDTDVSGNPTGNPFASLLFGYSDNINGGANGISSINIYPAVETKSKETGFYFQDDWKVNSKLTLNLGLRYEWSTPYTERNNHVQFSNFTGQQRHVHRFEQRRTDARIGNRSVERDYPVSHLEYEERPCILEKSWAAARLCLPTESEYRRAWRRGYLLRHERGYELPVSRHRVPQECDHVFHAR